MRDTTLEQLRETLRGRRARSHQDHSLSPAAVLLLLYRKDGEHCVLLSRRTSEVAHHKDEVSFPGGVRDPQDPDLHATALREAQEEVGVHPEDVTILGDLDTVTTPTRFAIHPFVGTIPPSYPFRVNPREVAEVLEVPVKGLRDRANVREEIRWVDGRPMKRYAYAYNGHVIYGATARILQQLLGLLEGVPL